MPQQLRNGKRRNYKRPLFEELPALDARWLARHKMIPKDWGRRVYPNFDWLNPGFTGLIITPRVIEIICRDGRQQIAVIHWQAIQGMCRGTIRPIFGCPCCGCHTFKLTWRALLLEMCLRPWRHLRLAASLTQRTEIPTKPTPAPLPKRISRQQHNPQAAVHALQDLQHTPSQTAPDRSKGRQAQEQISK